MILFFGVNVMTTLGLRDPQLESNALKDNVNPFVFILLGITLYAGIKQKLVNYNKELYFLIYISLFILYKFSIDKPASITFIINTFLGPSIIALLLRNIPTSKDFVLKLILIYFITESTISIMERILQTNIFTALSDINDYASDTSFRSLSIHGHPLQGALILSIIMGFIYIAKINFTKKLLFLLLGFIALLAFNTRSSIFYWSVLISFLIIKGLFTRKMSVKAKTIGICVLILSSISLIYLIERGWGGRIIEMSLYDENSAAVRVNLFYMFKFLNWNDILWGIPLESIEYIKYQSGIAIIENYWVIFIFSYGLIGTIILTTFTAICLSPLFKGYTFIEKIIIIGTLLMISSTNNSMATNTPAMFVFVMCAFAFTSKTKIKNNDTKKNSLLLVRKKAFTETGTQMY